MKTKEISMSQYAVRLGYWSAAAIAATFVVYTICFVAILIVSPLFTWTNLADYVAYTQANTPFFRDLAQVMMLFFPVLFMIMVNSLHEVAHDDQKILTRISSGCGTIFAALTGLNYFVQISVVRQNVAGDYLTGIEQFIGANPASFITAANMLGYTLFLGLASLFLVPLFSGGKLERTIRYAWLVNGICCLLGGVGYVLHIPVLVFVGITLGMGGAVLTAAIALAIFFKRMQTIPAR